MKKVIIFSSLFLCTFCSKGVSASAHSRFNTYMGLHGRVPAPDPVPEGLTRLFFTGLGGLTMADISTGHGRQIDINLTKSFGELLADIKGLLVKPRIEGDIHMSIQTSPDNPGAEYARGYQDVTEENYKELLNGVAKGGLFLNIKFEKRRGW
jgi:hypothetical protein